MGSHNLKFAELSRDRQQGISQLSQEIPIKLDDENVRDLEPSSKTYLLKIIN